MQLVINEDMDQPKRDELLVNLDLVDDRTHGNDTYVSMSAKATMHWLLPASNFFRCAYDWCREWARSKYDLWLNAAPKLAESSERAVKTSGRKSTDARPSLRNDTKYVRPT